MRRTSGKDGFGAVLITLHWSMATLIIVMFFMGRFMTDLGPTAREVELFLSTEGIRQK